MKDIKNFICIFFVVMIVFIVCYFGVKMSVNFFDEEKCYYSIEQEITTTNYSAEVCNYTIRTILGFHDKWDYCVISYNDYYCIECDKNNLRQQMEIEYQEMEDIYEYCYKDIVPKRKEVLR